VLGGPLEVERHRFENVIDLDGQVPAVLEADRARLPL
jgi:hypothetical protein